MRSVILLNTRRGLTNKHLSYFRQLTARCVSYVIEIGLDYCDVGDHLMGEAKRRQKLALKPAVQAISEAMGWVETPSGRLQVRWNDGGAVTPFGQMAFFIEFLNLTGLLDAWI